MGKTPKKLIQITAGYCPVCKIQKNYNKSMGYDSDIRNIQMYDQNGKKTQQGIQFEKVLKKHKLKVKGFPSHIPSDYSYVDGGMKTGKLMKDLIRKNKKIVGSKQNNVKKTTKSKNNTKVKKTNSKTRTNQKTNKSVKKRKK